MTKSVHTINLHANLTLSGLLASLGTLGTRYPQAKVVLVRNNEGEWYNQLRFEVEISERERIESEIEALKNRLAKLDHQNLIP